MDQQQTFNSEAERTLGSADIGEVSSPAGNATLEECDHLPPWQGIKEEFMALVPTELRPQVNAAIQGTNSTGAGLRAWLNRASTGVTSFPAAMPVELVLVYLAEPDAMPLYDCEDCGVAIPVIPSRAWGLEADPERILFEICPICGGRTGPFLYWTSEIGRRKPR